MTAKERSAKYGPTITVRLSPRMAALLERVRVETGGQSRSRLVAEALATYLAPKAGKRELLHLEPLVMAGRSRMEERK